MTLGLKSFEAQIDAAVAQVDGALLHILQHTTMIVAENVIVGGEFSPGTPVDTGFARSSWWLSINTPDGTPTNAVPGGQASLDAILLAIPEVKVGDVVYLMNNAAYIGVLEDGWSKQAPFGFIEVTVAKGQLIVDKVVKGLPQT